MNVAISTERLVLREATVDDATFILKLLNDKGWLAYIGDRNVKTLGDAKKYINNSLIASYVNNGFGLYVVNLTSNKSRIGLCGLVKRPALDNIDIGFAFLDQYCRKGYGFESAKAVLDYAFNELRLPKIVGITLGKNLPSRSLLEKIGLSFEKFITNEAGEKLMMYALNSPYSK